MKIDSVIMNPPYSMTYSADAIFKYDPRFKNFPLAPKSKADYMFLLDGLSRLSDNGRMAILLPHGVLFRGGSEEQIRIKLIESGYIDSVIGLPENLFGNTAIPTVALVLCKDKKDKSIFFINASKEFEKTKPTNTLAPENIKRIKDAYKDKKDIVKFAKNISYQQLEANGFNLNIPRYINNFDKEPPVDFVRVQKEMEDIDREIEQTRRNLYELSKNLVSSTKSKELQALVKMFGKANYNDLSKIITNAKFNEVMDTKDNLPSKEFQQLAIDFLDSLEVKENLQEQKIEKLKDTKKFLIDNMFAESEVGNQ